MRDVDRSIMNCDISMKSFSLALQKEIYSFVCIKYILYKVFNSTDEALKNMQVEDLWFKPG